MTQIRQGIDIVDIAKFRDVLYRHASFVDDLFTGTEKHHCLSRRDPHLQFAEFFAAKESYLKALGTGFRGVGIDHVFRDIEITVRAPGRYQASVTGWAGRLAKAKRVRQCSISISHAPGYAVAWTLLFSAENERPEGKCGIC